jgi:hypothetical protein
MQTNKRSNEARPIKRKVREIRVEMEVPFIRNTRIQYLEASMRFNFVSNKANWKYSYLNRS